jgi:hypothetical protein
MEFALALPRGCEAQLDGFRTDCAELRAKVISFIQGSKKLRISFFTTNLRG